MKPTLRILASLAAILYPAGAWAHPGHEQGGFGYGFLHPLTGIDHLVAMLLVGIGAGLLMERGGRYLPVSFLAAMLLGFAASAALPLAGLVEPVIILSLVVLGAAAALRLKVPLSLAILGTAIFGYAHGAAHGIETPVGAAPAVFAAGFLFSSLGLQLLGCWLARLVPAVALRAIGTAGAGLGVFLAGTI